MTLGRWLAGLIAVGLVLAATTLLGRALRRRMVPELRGATAILAAAILAVATIVVVLQALGLVGLLQPLPVALAFAAVGVAGWRIDPARPRQRLPQRPSLPALLAAGLAATVAAAWLRRTLVSLDLGIGGVDSLWYHLPFASFFVERGSIASAPYVDLEFLTAFYPANVELLHAGGMLAFDADVLSPWLSLAALALALLAGWCAGAARGAGPAGLVAAAAVFALPSLFDSQPGEAKNDTFALGCLLASAAILLAGRPGAMRPGAVAVAGLAAGLALGTKLSFLAPIGALTIAVAVLAPRARRLPLAGAWAAGLSVPAIAWYARNLALTGNPLPWLDLGPLPEPAEPRSADTADALSSYLFDAGAWDEHFLPGLELALGPAWWAVLALAGLGIVLAIVRGDRTVRALGLVALVTAAAYVVTPSTAAGPEGEPIGFWLNVRYLTPALLLGLCLLPVALPRRSAVVAGVALAIALLATQTADSVWAFEHRRKALAVLLLALAALAVARLRPPRPALAVAAASALLVALGAGWTLSRDYQRQAYTGKLLPYTSWAGFDLDRAYTWARGQRGLRIAVSGTTGAFFQHPLAGPRLDNEVRLLGDRGAHGSFTPLRTCEAFRRALDDGRFTHLVTTPDLDIWNPYRPLTPREPLWVGGSSARAIVVGERVRVFALPRAGIGTVGCTRP